MKTTNFYRIKEIKKAKKEKRQPAASFGITTNPNSLYFFINKYNLMEDYVWNTEY